MSDINKNLAIFGLRPGAKQIEIKNAFRNLAQIYHPDNKETGSARKFIEINDAYEAVYNDVLFKKELKELEEDPEAYHRARAKYPSVFEPPGPVEPPAGGSSTTSKQTPTIYTGGKNDSGKTTETPPPKKNDNDGGAIVPFLYWWCSCSSNNCIIIISATIINYINRSWSLLVIKVNFL